MLTIRVAFPLDPRGHRFLICRVMGLWLRALLVSWKMGDLRAG